MKIGIDYRMGGNIHAGIGRYVSQLLRRILARDKNNGYTLFYNRANFIKEEIDFFARTANVKTVETNSRHYSLGEQTSFLRTLNSHDLDLVHFPNFNLPLLYRRPYVVTIHDMVHHKISGHKKTHLVHFL